MEYYPSISEDLLLRTIEFAEQYTSISKQDRDIILHPRKSLLFSGDNTWMKKNGRGLFNVTMGCFDGAKVRELVGTYALSKVAHKISSSDVGLYHDDGLAVLRDVAGSEADQMRKTVCKIFNNLGLQLTIDTGMMVVNFLDVTLNLADGTYRPYRKPNDTPVYVHSQLNHPPTIKQIPKAISRRLTNISSNQDAFRDSAPLYSYTATTAHLGTVDIPKY